jgi:hypothetical protein
VVLVAAVAAALALVVPALGISTTGCTPDTTTCVKPASGQGITPSVVNVGGTNFSCATNAGGTPAGMNVRQFQISNPVPGLYTDSATGVQFRILAPSAGLDSKAFLSFRVEGNAAVVYHVGIKGGTNSSWYDYFNNTPSAKALGNGGVFSDTDLHSTPDSQYRTSPASKNTFFASSITTFCYVPLTVQASCDHPFSGGPGFGGGTGDAAQYFVQLVAQNGACKTGNMVMYSYVPGTNQLFAVLSPVTPGGPNYESVEHIHETGIAGDNQNPITLKYDDTAPYDGVDHAGGVNDGFRVMKFCGSDPRPYPSDPPLAAGQSPFDLGGAHPAMPPADADGPHTSCMLQSTDSAGSGGTRTYDAWVYSNIDGLRGH